MSHLFRAYHTELIHRLQSHLLLFQQHIYVQSRATWALCQRCDPCLTQTANYTATGPGSHKFTSHFRDKREVISQENAHNRAVHETVYRALYQSQPDCYLGQSHSS